jgi:hypothetical protein
MHMHMAGWGIVLCCEEGDSRGGGKQLAGRQALPDMRSVPYGNSRQLAQPAAGVLVARGEDAASV